MTTDQAQGLRMRSTARAAEQDRSDRLLAVVSGKGGVGKTNVVVNTAMAAAGLGARVLIVDGDLGLANVDLLLGLVPRRSVADALDARVDFDEVIARGPRGIDVLPAASGRTDLAQLAGERCQRLLDWVGEASTRYDLVLVDAGAGIGGTPVRLTGACGRAWLVVNPEPTTLADAYAMAKVLRAARPDLPLEVLVNGAADALEARRTHDHLERMVRRFVGGGLAYRGALPHDPRLPESVTRQRAAVELFPKAAWSTAVVALARQLLRDIGSVALRKPIETIPPTGVARLQGALFR